MLQASVMLPMMFKTDFGNQIGQYATMVDKKNNQFEVLVERNNVGIYLTRGWGALSDFYNIPRGGWVTIVFVGDGRFNIRVQDRFGKKIRCPTFSPPMKFCVDRNAIPITLFNVVPAPFVHDELNFQHTYEKILDSFESNAGVLVKNLLLLSTFTLSFLFGIK
jgi:hypothetical protein